MYPIKFEKVLSYLKKSKKKNVLFLSCISFEPRCKKATRMIKEYKNDLNILWTFFQIIDNGSRYEDECLEKQNKYQKEILEIVEETLVVPKFELFNTSKKPEEKLISYFKEMLKNKSDIQVIIIDITTIPKKVYFPFLEWLMESLVEDFDIIVCYSKPIEYDSEMMELEPQKPETLIGRYKRNRDILWIPSLGFKSEFTEIIWEDIKKMNSPLKILKKEIKPILGFPAYRPDFYDKCLLFHVKTFKKNAKFLKSLKNPIYSSADDPFEIYNKLKNIYENNLKKEIILSPLGPKPISLGLALFAIQKELPVFSVQAKTYHPNFSKGEGETSAYWLIRNNEYTFST